ncbi:MAG: hypothetical protein AB7I18_04010 [Candidatus Berkiella sp.]
MPNKAKSFGDLSDKYQNVSEILNDPDLEALAFASDMSKADLANILIKRFAITHGVLAQPVEIPLKQPNQEVTRRTLNNPVTGGPLSYGDFLTDRSGPKFGGYLNDSAAREYLISNPQEFENERGRMVQSRIQETQNKFPNIQDAEKLELAASVFNRPHRTQRKLSDFDLTASGLASFQASVKLAVEGELGRELPASLAKTVADTLWEVGGEVDIGLIQRIMGDENNPPQSNIDYRKEVEAQVKAKMADHQDYPHILSDGPGKQIFEESVGLPNIGGHSTSAEADTQYGLGIPFMGTEVRADPKDGSLHLTSQLVQDYHDGKLDTQQLQAFFPGEDIKGVIKHHGLYEIGDIICDSRSHYEHAFSQDKNIQATCDKIIAVVGKEKWHEQLGNDQGLPNEVRLAEIIQELIKAHESEPDKQQDLKAVETEFKSNQSFLESYSLFEECAKKDAQSQIFKLESQRKLTVLQREAERLKPIVETAVITGSSAYPVYFDKLVKVNAEISDLTEGTKKKLIGNISDVEPFIAGVIEKTQSSDPAVQQQAKAHLQCVVLSLMINAPRWGINSQNYTTVGQGEHVDAAAFQQSINSRSYAYEPGSDGPRKAIGWDNISFKEANARLDSYYQGMDVAWQDLRQQQAYFALVGDFKQKLVEVDKIDRKIEKSPDYQQWKNWNAELSQNTAQINQLMQKHAEDPNGAGLLVQIAELERKNDILENKINGSQTERLMNVRHTLVNHVEQAKGRVHEFLKEHIKTAFPELHQRMASLNPNPQDQDKFIQSLTAQIEESIVFGNKREAKLMEKAKNVNQHNRSSKEDVIPTNIVIDRVASIHQRSASPSPLSSPMASRREGSPVGSPAIGKRIQEAHRSLAASRENSPVSSKRANSPVDENANNFLNVIETRQRSYSAGAFNLHKLNGNQEQKAKRENSPLSSGSESPTPPTDRSSSDKRGPR